MNRVALLMVGMIFTLSGWAQTDTTKNNSEKGDTIRVGNLLIVRSGGPRYHTDRHVSVTRHRGIYNPANVSTNWGIVDIGVANFRDQTNYASASAQAFAPGSTKDWFKLRGGKSVDVNIWIFMQRVNLIKHVVNLKYGLGIELNNYRWEDDIRFKTKPTQVIMDTISYSKNKLAADYVTVPFLLNFNFTPHRRQDFGFSVGASVGYKYSSRQKFKSSAHGKEKTFDDFDMEDWKISYIGELQLGILKLYGSYATKSMFAKGLDMTPYTVGIRLGNW
ncbi:MAG: outer membrane beta-barrel protein [Bacteroidetes bacterium]|nr:outer membrane beta-barrel protein [Bacteroidota bacterium]